MKCNFELSVPNNSWLVDQSKLSVNMYYLSGNHCDSNFVQQLEMNIISETNPDQRFHKLITKDRLDEAEIFGKQFNLCLQPLYEAKAKKIIASMSTIDKVSIHCFVLIEIGNLKCYNNQLLYIFSFSA